MSANFKGKQGIVLISEEPVFDAKSGVQEFDQTFAGSKSAIFGFAQQLKDDNISFRVTNSGPVYQITARVPQNDPTEVAELDRYEIFTESQDKSIFEHPTIIADAEDYDANLTTGDETYQKIAEDNVDSSKGFTGSYFSDPTPQLARANSVIRHLKAKATGFQNDFLGLRRFRQIDTVYAYAAGKFNLEQSTFIYTTAQLNLPANVAFAIPSAPSDPSSDYSWGWRRRGQRVEIIGQYAEQTVELLFAPWSTLLYEPAGGALAW